MSWKGEKDAADLQRPKGNLRFLWASVVILLAGTAFRVSSLHEIPPGLSQDEVLNADIVEFIRGGRLELFFREGFGHEPLFHYLGVPFQLLLGDNVLSMRLPAVFLGLLVIALTLRWARREFGNVAALTAGVGLAISWWPIVFSRVGIRPILLPVFLLLMAWNWRKRPWLAGIFLGLSLYTYTPAVTMLALPLIMAVFIVVHKIVGRNKSGIQNPKSEITIFIIAVLIYAPLFLTLRADPTLLERGDQLSGPVTALLSGDWRPLWQTTLATLGVFSFTGDPRWTYALPGRPLFDPLTALLFYGGLVLAVVHIGRYRNAFILAWLVCGLLPSMVTPDAPSTIRMIAALPVVYLLPGLSVDWVWQFGRRHMAAAEYADWRKLSGVGFIIIIAGFVMLNVGLTVRDGFIRWPQAFETREKYQTMSAEMAAYLAAHPNPTPVINTGFYYPIDADTIRRNLGRDPATRWTQAGQAVVLPGGNAIWLVPEASPVDPHLATLLGLNQPRHRSLEKPGFAVYALPEGAPIALSAEAYTFGDVITLIGHQVETVQENGSIMLSTMWRVEQALPDDLKLFVHLVSAENDIVSQHDGLDAIPETLHAGDLIVQRHVLPGAPTTDAPLTLHIGVYTANDGIRIMTTGSTAGSKPYDAVILPLPPATK